MLSARGAISPSPAEVHGQRRPGHHLPEAGDPLASERPPAASWEGGNFSVTVGHLELAGCCTCCTQTYNQHPELWGGFSSYIMSLNPSIDTQQRAHDEYAANPSDV